MQRALGGKVCTGFETGLAPLARVNDDAPLAGRLIEKVEARGKWLLVHFSGDRILLTHMLMSGSWHLYKTGEKWWMGKDRMRAVIRTEDWQAVAFNVPVAEFHTARSLERYSQVPKLGVDVLSDEYSVEAGVAKLRAYRREPSGGGDCGGAAKSEGAGGVGKCLQERGGVCGGGESVPGDVDDH